MKLHKLTVAVLSVMVVLLCQTEAKIEYFWHISDFHYDPLYTTQGDTRRHCRKTDGRMYEDGNSGQYNAVGRFGNYACDSPLDLIVSAANFMKNKQPDRVEFVLWTGDIVSSHYGDEQQKFLAIKKVTEVLQETFKNQFVFPVLGHLDPDPSKNLAKIWSRWLPGDALKTFAKSGYYTIDHTNTKLRIVVLNTNLFGVWEMSNPHAKRQWEWLLEVLEIATAKREMCYIVGHRAPGTDLGLGQNEYSKAANEKYMKIIRKYAKIIAGQFFGHAHADTFRVFYDKGKPVSWGLLAPSVTPHRESWGSSNPGLRLFKHESCNGKILDYTQYYLDLEATNKAGIARWTYEYNLTQYYGLQEINSNAFHNIAVKLTNGPLYDAQVSNKFVRAYNVKSDDSQHMCDTACKRQHYCAITRLRFRAYKQCVAAAAAAGVPVPKLLVFFITFVLSFFFYDLHY